jgi:hypothetical protein
MTVTTILSSAVVEIGFGGSSARIHFMPSAKNAKVLVRAVLKVSLFKFRSPWAAITGPCTNARVCLCFRHCLWAVAVAFAPSHSLNSQHYLVIFSARCASCLQREMPRVQLPRDTGACLTLYITVQPSQECNDAPQVVGSHAL